MQKHNSAQRYLLGQYWRGLMFRAATVQVEVVPGIRSDTKWSELEALPQLATMQCELVWHCACRYSADKGTSINKPDIKNGQRKHQSRSVERQESFPLHHSKTPPNSDRNGSTVETI
jgi:hypothetical protein